MSLCYKIPQDKFVSLSPCAQKFVRYIYGSQLGFPNLKTNVHISMEYICYWRGGMVFSLEIVYVQHCRVIGQEDINQPLDIRLQCCTP